MNEWLKQIVRMLLVVVFIAGMVRLAWDLLRPAVPGLIATLVALAIIRLIWQRKSQGW